MDETVTPAGIPESIVKRREALWLYLVAVGTLAVIGVGSVLGAIVLAFFDKPAPEMLVALAGGAVTALAGMVATGNK